MSDTGPISPASATEYDGGGAAGPWSDSTLVLASDDAWAESTSLSAGDVTTTIRATFPSFGIPSGAVIDGIYVEVESFYTGSSGAFLSVFAGLESAGDASDQLASFTTIDFTIFESIQSTGGPADLGGWAGIVDADLNSGLFFVDVVGGKAKAGSAVLSIDQIQVTIYYTASGGGGTTQPFRRDGYLTYMRN